jgi:hypothetical protein
MLEKKKKNKKETRILHRDLKPRKDAKGGGFLFTGASQSSSSAQSTKRQQEVAGRNW